MSLLENWAGSDPDAASVWLGKLPEGEFRAEVVLAFAWRLADKNPERAAEYLPELPESKGRGRLVKKIEEGRQ